MHPDERPNSTAADNPWKGMRDGDLYFPPTHPSRAQEAGNLYAAVEADASVLEAINPVDGIADSLPEREQ